MHQTLLTFVLTTDWELPEVSIPIEHLSFIEDADAIQEQKLWETLEEMMECGLSKN